MHRTLSLVALALCLPISGHAFDKGVAIVTSPDATNIQTGTEVRRDLMGECIVKLPSESQLVPVTTAVDTFLHKIDGTPKEDYVSVWTSTIQIGYQVRQRYLYVISTNGVGQGAAPQTKEVTAQVFQAELVASDASESQRFYIGTTRVRFNATAQEAETSVKKRAAARLRELQANVCPN